MPNIFLLGYTGIVLSSIKVKDYKLSINISFKINVGSVFGSFFSIKIKRSISVIDTTKMIIEKIISSKILFFSVIFI